MKEPFTRGEDAQQFVLREAYAHFRNTGQWPLARDFDVEHGDSLDPIGGLELLTRQLGVEKVTPVNPQNPNDRVTLGLRGMEDLPEAQEDVENLLKTVRLAARRYRESSGNQNTISVKDLVAHEGLEENAAKRAIHLFGSVNGVSGGGSPDQYVVQHAIRRFSDVHDLNELLARVQSEWARQVAIAQFGPSSPQSPPKGEEPQGGLHLKTAPADATSMQVLASADEPIQSRAADLLGRAPFAKAIADALSGWTGQRSLVVGILGAWGTGKSSVKNMVREVLAAAPPERRLRILEFSPWQWSTSRQLASGFFRELAGALNLTDRHQRDTKLAKSFAAYAAKLNAGAILTASVQSLAWTLWGVSAVLAVAGILASPPAWLAGALGAVVAIGAVIGAVLKRGGKVAQAIGDALGAGARASARTLEELKAELAKELDKRPLPLVVIIDDVDRLSTDEIPLLFQLVKANADFPNVLYLLLFQRDIVEQALETAAPGRDARGYLEKIIQVPFTLPPVEQSRLEAVLDAGLNEILAAPELRRRFDEHRLQNLYLAGLRPYFRTVRDVRRFLSTLAFHVSMFRGAGTFEVNVVDLIALEVLHVFEFDVYDALAASKELLTEAPPDQRLYGKPRVDAIRTAIHALVDRAAERHGTQVREILKELFPITGWAFDNVSFSSAEDQWFRDLRVGHPDVFDRYFLLATPRGDISEAELQRLIAMTRDRDALVRELEGLRARGLLLTALDRLDSYKDRIPLANAVPMATALYDVGDDISDEQFGGSSLIPGSLSPGRIVKWHFLQDPDPASRRALLETAIRATRGLYLPVRQVSLEVRDPEDTTKTANWLLDESDVGRLKALCVERISAAATDGSLERQAHLAYLLYRWREWAGPDAPKAYVARLLETPNGALSLLRGFLHEMRRSTMGESVPRVIRYIKLSELEHFVPLDLLEQQVTAAESAIRKEDRVSVDAFRAALLRKREGRPEDEV